MTTLEYRDILAESMIKSFILEFKEKTGLKISINIHDDSILKETHISDLERLPVVSLRELEAVVLDTIPYRVNSIELRSRNRKRELVDARSIFAHLARRFRFKYKSIGEYIDRDHTSIIHLERKAFDLMETDPVYLSIYTKITDKIKEKYDKVI